MNRQPLTKSHLVLRQPLALMPLIHTQYPMPATPEALRSPKQEDSLKFKTNLSYIVSLSQETGLGVWLGWQTADPVCMSEGSSPSTAQNRYGAARL